MRLVDLIYGKKMFDDVGLAMNMNGIIASDGYIMAGIYYEADLDTVFFRRVSKFESYEQNNPYNRSSYKIETQNIPVFSFRFKNPFCKS